MPKVVREWRKPQAGVDWMAWVYAFAFGLLGVFVLAGCAASVSLGKVDAGLQVDPGKLAPLFQRRM